MTPFFSKRKVGNALESWGWVYLVSCLLCIIALIYFSHAITDFKDYETFSYFFETYEAKEYDWGKLTQSACPEIQKVDVYDVSPKEALKGEKFASFGKTSDVLVLLESDLLDMKEVIRDYLRPFSKEEESTFLPSSVQSFSAYGDDFAFLIHDADNPSYDSIFPFSDLFSFGDKNEDFYLCVSSSSVHFGGKTDFGFSLLPLFFSEGR